MVDVRGWWDSHWPGMQTAVATWWTNIQPKLADAYTAIRDKVGQAVVDVRGWWDEHWPAMQTAVSTWWTNIQDKLSDAAEAIRDKVGQAVIDLKDSFEENWPKAQTAIETWWAAVQPKLAEAIDYFGNQLVAAVQDVAAAFEENWPKAQAAVSDWWTEAGPKVTEAIDQLGTSLPEALGKLEDKYAPLIEAQKKYYDLLPQLIELSESFRDVGDAIKEKMGEWIEFGWGVLLTKLQELWKFLSDSFNPVWLVLKGIFDDTATAISTVLIGAYNSIRDKFNEVKPIADLFAGAMSAISGAIDAISSAIQSAITWLSNLADKIRNLPSPPAWFVGHSPPPLANWFAAIGEAAGQVATEGIPALAQALNQDLSATGMIEGIITDANNALGIHSPSTVFMEIGIAMIEGLLAGIDSQKAEAAAKIAGFLRTIVGAFDALVEFMEQLDSYDLSGVRGRWDARGISVFTAWITGLADDMAVMAQALATVSQGIETSVQEAVKTYLSNMGGVTDALAEVLDVLVLLDEVVETGLMARLEAWRASSELSRWVNVLAEVLGVMARALGTVAANLSSEIQTAIREFSATLVEVIEPLSAMLGLWEDLDRAVEEGIAYPEHLTTTLDDILRSYGELVQVLNRWTSAEYSASLPEITYEVQELVDDLGTLIAPFEEMLGFWEKLQETIVAKRGWSSELLPMFVDILSSYGDIVSAITAALAQEVRGFDPDLLTQEVIDFTARLDGLLAPFAEMLAFWEDLDAAIANNRGWSNSDFDVLWNILKTYSQVLAALHVAMSGEDRFLLGITPDLVTDELVAFVARLNGLLSPFSAMIDFWEDLDAAIARGRGWSNADLAVLWDILKTYAQVLAVLHVAMTGTDRDLLGITPELVTDELIAFTARLNGLLAPFSAMIDFWAKLATAAVPPNLPALGATLDAMLEGYSAVAERLTTTVETFYGLQEVPVIEVTEVMTTFAAQLSGLLAPFTAMADFWTKLDGVAAPAGDFGALVDRALQMYGQVAERLTTTVETFYGLQEVPVIEVTEVMTAFAAQLSGLLAPFSAMIDFWAKLAEMAAPDVDFAAVIEEMLGYYSELVTALETLLADTVAAGGSLEIAPEIIAYTQAISAISSALIAPLDYLAELQTAIEDGVLGGAGIPDVATALDQLRQFMIQVVTAMNDLMADPEVGALDETAEEFAAWISSSIGTFSTALNLVSQLATAVASKAFEPFTTVEQVGLNIEVQLQYLRDAIRQIALAIDLLMDDPDLAGLSNTSAAFATWFNASVGPFSTALDLVSRLAQAVAGEVFEPFTTVEQVGLNIEVQLQFLRDAIRQMAASIRLMMDDPELQGLDETVDGFATRIGAIAAGLGGAVSFLAELGAWEAATGLEAQINQFAITWVMVLERLAQISSETRALADEEMRRFASATGDIGAGLQRAIGFLVDLGAWKRAANLEELIDELVRVTEYTLQQLADVVDDWTDEGLQLVTTFGQAVGSVMSGLQAAFQMAAEAPESWGVDQGMWDAFFTWVTGVFTQFTSYVEDWATDQTDPTNLAGVIGAVGSALGSLMAGLQAAADFELSADWTAPAPALWDAFFLWVTGVFTQFSDYVEAWATDQEDPTNQASLIGAVAGALSGVMQGLQSALQLAAAFPQTWAAPDPAQFQAFIDWVMGIFDDLYDWVVLNLPDSVAAAANLPVVQALGSAMGAVFGGLQAAFQMAAEAPESWEIDEGLWQAFLDWATDAFTQFAAYVAEWAALQEDPGNLAGLVGSVGSALGSLMAGLQAATDFELSAEWTAPAPALWDAFFMWVTGVFDAFSAYVAAWAALQEDPGNLAGLVGSVGSALGSLMAGLQAAADFELSADWTAPAPALWDAFFLWVTGVFTQFSDYVEAWATDQEDPTNQASLIGAVAGALSGVMQGLQSALQLAAAFPQTWAAPDPAQFQAFIDWVMGIFDDLYDWVVLNLPDSVAAAANLPVVQALGSAMGAVFGGLQAALDLSQGFWFTTPNTGLWSAFQSWVLGVFMDLHNWVLANFPTSPEDATATFAPVMAFAQALDAITGGLSSALDLLRDVMDTDTGSYSQTEGFTLFQDRVGWLMEGIDTVLDAFLTWVVSGETGWLDTAAAFAGAVGAVFDVLSQALGVFGTLTDEDIPSLDQINAFIDAVLNLFGSFTGALLTAGGDIGDAVAGAGAIVWGMPTYLPDGAVVGGWGSGIGAAFAGALASYEMTGDVAAFAASAQSLMTAALGGGSTLESRLWGLGGGSGEDYAYALAYYSGLSYYAGILATRASSALNPQLGDGSALSGTMGGWGEGLSGGMTGGLIAYMASSAAAGDMITMASNLWWAVQNAIFNGSDPLNQLMMDAGWGVGQNLVFGIANGMNNWTGTMVTAIDQAVAYIVDYIINQINSNLGIASPSTVFAEIGHFIPLGLAVGIEDGIPAVRSAAAELFAAVGEYTDGQDWRIQPSTVAVTQRQRVEVVVSGDVSVGGERLSVAQREDIAQVIIQRLRARG